ncbi:MAG: phosphatase PAP2 family protein [Ruminococcus sp.]|nr:phosphatase PAP2 family protein [Ruminococcus sp.]
MGFFDLIIQIDFSILNFIQEFFRCSFLDVIMPFFSNIGEVGIVWIIIGLIMLFFRKTRSWGIILLCSMLIGYIVGEVAIKNIICRVRPCYFVDINMIVSKPHSYSFPSGHSCSSFAAATVLLKMNKRFGIPALILASLIAFSRLYNYVHYPTDVLCGIVLGVLCALLVCYLFKKFRWQKKIDDFGTRSDINEIS